MKYMVISAIPQFDTMCEIIFRARPSHRTDPVELRISGKRQGKIEAVMPDGYVWGDSEGPPLFMIMKLPGVPVSAMERYLEQVMEVDPLGEPDGSELRVRRARRWELRFSALPQQARDRLASSTGLIVRSPSHHTGPADFTWAQMRGFFRDLETGLDETREL